MDKKYCTNIFTPTHHTKRAAIERKSKKNCCMLPKFNDNKIKIKTKTKNYLHVSNEMKIIIIKKFKIQSIIK